ncbi:LysM peptidoglycan-binding domain-containing protein [Nonomuraea phyllanthi]|uniref:LysM peptidoglycan-binding domain-containing protein n=1 Tax=Nonomuraea phyllanthi TaxID=2219224 RepID=A0A5C4WWX9_9ACTN|nr:LysM peptidoglycan-binding domain-containing protein [Nonomuraea phyllanthi]KAB8197703.1 LysM peptidoglycan-binding domain-containing protein [Nonomuraea phyllanthi]QFY06320.1 LysM peptidoglycan-binding domain-containing protein [Nonomuraea phyllanthi]
MILKDIGELIEVMGRAWNSVGDERDIHRLETMAEAVARTKTDLQKVHDGLPEQADKRGWTGLAAEHHKDMEYRHLNRAELASAIKNLGTGAQVLQEAAKASAASRQAMIDIRKMLWDNIKISGAIAVGMGAMGLWARWAMVARASGTAAVATTAVASRQAAMLGGVGRAFGMIGRVMEQLRVKRGLSTVRTSMVSAGKSRFLHGVIPNGLAPSKTTTLAGSFLRPALSSMSNYWSMGALAMTGGWFANGFGNLTRGEGFVTPWGGSYVALARSGAMVSWLSATTRLGAIARWTTSTSKNSMIMDAGMGVVATAGPQFVIDLSQGKPLNEALKNAAIFSSVGGVYNTAAGAALRRFLPGGSNPGLTLALGSFGSVASGSALRYMVPLDARPVPDYSMQPSVYNAEYDNPDYSAPTIPAPPVPERVAVGPQETLSDIAKRVYGDDNKWRLIYNANRDVIGDDPNVLAPGQQLRIPELSE